MQVIRTICIAILMAVQMIASESLPVRELRPERITSAKYGFSVIFPRKWFVFEPIDPPVLFSYPPSEALPQDLLPVNGARITFPVREVQGQDIDLKSLTVLAEKLVKTYAGFNARWRPLDANKRPSGISLGLHVAFDAGTEDSVHIEEDLLPFKTHVIGIMFECANGDPRCKQHEHTFQQVVGSFRLEQLGGKRPR